MVAQPALKLGGGELAVRLDHGPLAVHPPGLDRVQPRAPARQAADREAAAAAGGLDPTVVGHDPGADLAADVPGASSRTRARTRTPSAASRPATQARKGQVTALTGRPATNR